MKFEHEERVAWDTYFAAAIQKLPPITVEKGYVDFVLTTRTAAIFADHALDQRRTRWPYESLV